MKEWDLTLLDGASTSPARQVVSEAGAKGGTTGLDELFRRALHDPLAA